MKKKHTQYPLNLRGLYRDNAQEVINRLFEIPRTGWIDRNVENPETVGEHTEALIILGKRLFNIPGLNKMLKIHDWAESDKDVGDLRTDSFCPPEHRWTKEQKYKVEFEAMQRICAKLGSEGDRIMKLWLEYEEQKTHRAKIAYQLDKLQAIMKAIEYQKQGQPVMAQEFIDHDGDKITDVLLREILKKVIL